MKHRAMRARLPVQRQMMMREVRAVVIDVPGWSVGFHVSARKKWAGTKAPALPFAQNR
jgi:hypothetical protein